MTIMEKVFEGVNFDVPACQAGEAQVVITKDFVRRRSRISLRTRILADSCYRTQRRL